MPVRLAGTHPHPPSRPAHIGRQFAPASWRLTFCRLTFQHMTKPRKMPPPWIVVEIPGGFRVDDAEGKSLAYCYGLEPRELPAAGHLRLTKDEARRVASNIAKLPDLLNT